MHAAKCSVWGSGSVRLEGYGVIGVPAPFGLWLCLEIIYNVYRKAWGAIKLLH